MSLTEVLSQLIQLAIWAPARAHREIGVQIGRVEKKREASSERLQFIRFWSRCALNKSKVF